MIAPTTNRLLAFGRELQRATSYEDLLAAARSEVQAVLGFEHAWIFVAIAEDARQWRLVDSASAKRDDIERVATILHTDGDPMMEEIAKSDHPVVVVDARTDPRTDKKIVEALGNRTIINVPLRLVDEPLGAFGVGTFGDEGCRTLEAHELDYLVGIAGQLSLAAGRLRLVQERRRAALLADFSHDIAGVRNLRELLQLVARRISEHIGDGANVRVLREDGQAFDATFTASFHPDPDNLRLSDELAASQPLRLGEGLTGRVVQSGRAVLVPRISTAEFLASVPREHHARMTALDIASLLCVPLRTGQQTVGAIALSRSSKRPPYTIVDQTLAQELADRAALAIVNARVTDALRLSEARFRRLTESGILGIALTDSAGRFHEANDAFLAMTGYTREDFLAGKLSAASLDTGEQRDQSERNRELLRTIGVAPLFERELLRKDGGRVVILAGVARLDETSAENIVFAVDVSERRRADALKAEAENLRREKESAEASNAELRAFSYSVAHDLRAPLRAIAGFTGAIAEDYADKLDDAGKALVGRVVSNVERMGELIDALLALAKVSQADLVYERVDLGAVARNVVEQMRAGDPTRDVELVVRDGLVTNGDPRLLRAALENLLGNAWKFTRSRERSRIELGRERARDTTSFYVRDNGAGFDMQYAHRLFAPFQRLHPANEFEGTGIGLATVQRIVRRHGGRVWAEARPNEGATFYFTLPEMPSS